MNGRAMGSSLAGTPSAAAWLEIKGIHHSVFGEEKSNNTLRFSAPLPSYYSDILLSVFSCFMLQRSFFIAILRLLKEKFSEPLPTHPFFITTNIS